MPRVNKADRYGQLKAKLAEVQAQIDELRNVFVESGMDEISGKEYVVKIVRGQKSRVDWRSVAEKLEPSHQLVSAHTKTSDFAQVHVSEV